MSVTDTEQTIAAVASPSGPGRRGIIRVSGRDCLQIVSQCFTPQAGHSSLSDIRRPVRVSGTARGNGISLPVPAAAMVWPNERSYTGQPMVELHLISSAPLLDAILETLFEAGARGAGRGEFTLRSFLAGRIDLVQAEAVLGVIDAADHEELAAALTQLGGGITTQLADVRANVISLLGDLEAGLDFVEEDIEFITVDQICDRLGECRETVDRLLGQSEGALPSGHRVRVVLAGLPNAGKSTLFNRLVGDGKAIVSPVAGTTRDYLTAQVELGGLAVDLVDTAGWETGRDEIMALAQDLRSEQISTGDLIVWCQSCVMSDEDRATNRLLYSAVSSSDRTTDEGLSCSNLCVTTQVDRMPAGGGDSVGNELLISALNGRGMTELVAAICGHFRSGGSSRSELLSSTTARCRESLSATSTALSAAIHAAVAQVGDEIVAVELRAALEHLGIILGEVYTDDILDHIFSSFCIGK